MWCHDYLMKQAMFKSSGPAAMAQMAGKAMSKAKPKAAKPPAKPSAKPSAKPAAKPTSAPSSPSGTARPTRPPAPKIMPARTAPPAIPPYPAYQNRASKLLLPVMAGAGGMAALNGMGGGGQSMADMGNSLSSMSTGRFDPVGGAGKLLTDLSGQGQAGASPKLEQVDLSVPSDRQPEAEPAAKPSLLQGTGMTPRRGTPALLDDTLTNTARESSLAGLASLGTGLGTPVAPMPELRAPSRMTPSPVSTGLVPGAEETPKQRMDALKASGKWNPALPPSQSSGYTGSPNDPPPAPEPAKQQMGGFRGSKPATQDRRIPSTPWNQRPS